MSLEIVSIVAGTTSVALAIFAIWFGMQARRESQDNYNLTKDALADISTKAAVIEAVTSTTQGKLLDSVTDLIKPPRESAQEMILRTLPPDLNTREIIELLAQTGQASKESTDPHGDNE